MRASKKFNTSAQHASERESHPSTIGSNRRRGPGDGNQDGKPLQTASSNPGKDKLLHSAHVAARLGVPARTVRFWAEVGELPGFKIGRGKLWRFRESEILDYIRRKGGTAQITGK